MRIHWFNPENDLALAAWSPTYTPKKAAQALHNAGASLPLWYGAPGDEVLCYGVNAKWYERVVNQFGIEVGIFNHTAEDGQVPDPWGWSPYTRRFFLNEGFPESSLPTDADLLRLKELSHRRLSAEIVDLCADSLEMLAPRAYEAHTPDDAVTWLAEHPFAYIKHPWSGSGRGVMCTEGASAAASLKFMADAIHRQGSVMLEVSYHRVLDFARIYECKSGSCIDLGTSIFTTDSHNAYTGNLLASEEVRMSRVTGLIGAERFAELTRTLRHAIEDRIAPYYEGILGVDMYVSEDGIIGIAEINLRKTMGYVANCFSDRFLAPGVTGRYSVQPAVGFVDDDYTVESGRLVSGSLSLVPPEGSFTIVASVL